MYDETAALGIFAAFFGFFAIFGIIGLVNYILMSLGLMTMAKNQSIDNAWLAWIPIANMWVMGKVIRTIDLGEKKFEQAELILVIAYAISIVVSAIPVIGQLYTIALLVLSVLVFFKIYKMYAPGSEVLYTILSFVFAIIAPGILFFKIKDNTPVEL